MTERQRAILFVASILRRAKDWQEGQHALANEERFASLFTGDEMSDIEIAQSIIRDAEDYLGNALPY